MQAKAATSEKTISPQRRNHLVRYRAIQEMFNKLYHEENLRRDIIYLKIYDVYFIQPERINEILRMDLTNF